MTRFQTYLETELACKNTEQLYKTQYSEILVEYEDGFDMNTEKLITYQIGTSHSTTDKKSYVPVKFQKNTGRTAGKLRPQDTDSTRLQELSLMKKTHFGAIHYDIHLDMKLDYTISRTFQEMSLTELETLHQLCELERTQILQSLALAVPKIPNAGYVLSGNRSNFIDYEVNMLWCYACINKYHLCMFSKTKDAFRESQYSIKIKYILLIHSPAELFFGIQQSHVDQKTALW